MQSGVIKHQKKPKSNLANRKIINTDQGSQLTSEAFSEFIMSHGIRMSMDGRGRATDNVFIERLWRSIKYNTPQ